MRLIKNQRGQGLTEYTILLVLVTGVCVGVVKTIGSTTKAKLSQVHTKIKGLSIDPSSESRGRGRSRAPASFNSFRNDESSDN
jgi:Flp pilus assembly pilin Flp